jgi:hypothetical protein
MKVTYPFYIAQYTVVLKKHVPRKEDEEGIRLTIMLAVKLEESLWSYRLIAVGSTCLQCELDEQY